MEVVPKDPFFMDNWPQVQDLTNDSTFVSTCMVSRMSARVIWSSLVWTQKGGRNWSMTYASGGMSSAEGLPQVRPSSELLKRNAHVANTEWGLHSEAPPTSAAAVENTVTPDIGLIYPHQLLLGRHETCSYRTFWAQLHGQFWLRDANTHALFHSTVAKYSGFLIGTKWSEGAALCPTVQV